MYLAISTVYLYIYSLSIYLQYIYVCIYISTVCLCMYLDIFTVNPFNVPSEGLIKNSHNKRIGVCQTFTNNLVIQQMALLLHWLQWCSLIQLIYINIAVFSMLYCATVRYTSGQIIIKQQRTVLACKPSNRLLLSTKEIYSGVGIGCD